MNKVSMEMKKAELVEVALELKVEVKKSWNKAQLVEVINAFVESNAAVEEIKENEGAVSMEQVQMSEIQMMMEMAKMANQGNAVKEDKKIAPVKEEKKVSPVKKNVKDFTVNELLEYVSLRLTQGVSIYVSNKNETLAVRITHVENNMLKGYTSTNRKAVFSVYPKALINGTFKFVTGTVAGEIHNRLIKNVKEVKTDNTSKKDSRYLFAIERSGDFALLDRKEKTVSKPALDKSVVNIIVKTKFVESKAKDKAKGKPSLVDRLNAMYMNAVIK